jgi:hypothetical protein
MALFVLQMGDVLWKLEFALQLQDEVKPAAGGRVENDAYVSHNAAKLDVKEEILGVELDDSRSSHSFLKLLTQKKIRKNIHATFVVYLLLRSIFIYVAICISYCFLQCIVIFKERYYNPISSSSKNTLDILSFETKT